MKRNISTLVIAAAFSFMACNSTETEANHENHTTDKPATENAEHVTTTDDAAITTTAVTFPTIDAKAAASIKLIVDHYLSLKNALSNDDAKTAASAGKEMAAVISKMDKSLLSADQKKVFDENQEDLKEHAEHISENVGNIKHQREHFVGMSEDIYALSKAFGAGRPIYHAHCPMAQDNKGAMWMTEANEIKNPYFGSKMLKCGTVKEVIQ